MKVTKTIIKSAVTGIAVAALIFSTSCSKDESSQGPSATPEPEKLITNQRVIAEIDNKVQEIPAIAWYNSTMDKVIICDPKDQSKYFNFVDPAEINFLPPVEATRAMLLIFGDENDPNYRSYYKFSTRNVPNMGNSGSTVVVGNKLLNIGNTTFFTAEEESEDDLFHIGGFNTPTTSEAKVAIGIDGDMDALTTGNFQNEAEIFQYFHGLVFCMVYTNAILGNYAMLDWFNYLYESSAYLNNMAFVWIYAFTAQSWSIFFSQGGILNTVNGGLNFNGMFYGASVDNEALNESGSGSNVQYMEKIYGFGELRE